MTEPRNKKTVVLAGDIGGTKTHLGLFYKGKTRPLLRMIETYPSQEAPNLESIIEEFLEKHHAAISVACFGIAGPVVNGRCKTTNLPWDVSEARVKRRFKWNRVRLINDLTAMAHAIPLLNSRETPFLNKAKAKRGGNLALLAPGTGLGESLLIFHRGRYVPIPSEGGHVDFSPNNNEEVQLWQYLHAQYGHVSIERILSGPGLFNIYSWLKDSGQYKEPQWLAKEIKKTDPPRVITQAAMNKRQPLCVRSLDMFISILGAVAGNLALTGLTTGGVYMGGGIPPKILSKLMEGTFMKSFTDKGRFKGLLQKIPVKVILNERAALLGAASCAFEHVDQG